MFGLHVEELFITRSSEAASRATRLLSPTLEADSQIWSLDPPVLAIWLRKFEPPPELPEAMASFDVAPYISFWRSHEEIDSWERSEGPQDAPDSDYLWKVRCLQFLSLTTGQPAAYWLHQGNNGFDHEYCFAVSPAKPAMMDFTEGDEFGLLRSALRYLDVRPPDTMGLEWIGRALGELNSRH